MQTSTVLVATLFALTSFPFMGQSSPQDTAPAGSGVQQPTAPSANQTPGAVPGSQPDQAAPSASAETSAPTAAAPTTPAPELRPVSAELVGGQNVPIQSQIQSVGSSDASSAASAGSSAMDRGAMRGSTGTDTTSPSAPGSTASAPSQTPGGAPSGQSPAAGSATTTSAAPGTVVAKTGQIDIRTTAIPGVLLANNQPGQQDPRMAHASSVLLGAHKDVQLTGGTPLVIGLATSSGAAGTK